jgi:transposase, IS5 family
LLEEHQLTEQIFAEVRQLLEDKKLLLKSGTIVDATIISAPSSTKNAAKRRDPEMHQGKKHKRQWEFGMKVHVGASKQGLVHSLTTGLQSSPRLGAPVKPQGRLPEAAAVNQVVVNDD